MVATTLKKLPDEGSPGSFNYLTKKIKSQLTATNYRYR